MCLAGMVAGIGDEARKEVLHRIQSRAPLRVREVREVRECLS